MDGHFSEHGHGRSWTLILVRTLMDAHFSEDANGRSF